MLSALIGVLIICVVGAICFWAIEKFVLRIPNHAGLEAAGAFASDRASSISFSLAEGANGGDASAPVTAIICCW